VINEYIISQQQQRSHLFPASAFAFAPSGRPQTELQSKKLQSKMQSKMQHSLRVSLLCASLQLGASKCTVEVANSAQLQICLLVFAASSIWGQLLSSPLAAAALTPADPQPPFCLRVRINLLNIFLQDSAPQKSPPFSATFRLASMLSGGRSLIVVVDNRPTFAANKQPGGCSGG